MDRLLFGTAGIPVSTRGDTLQGIRDVKRLGLGAMELEFVRGINISEKKAPEVRKVAGREGVVLTCHAPYWINMNATDPEKLKASMARLLNSARIASLCGAWSVCFHAGFYMKMPRERAYQRVSKAIGAAVEELESEGNNIWIRPEIGGRLSSWGSLREVLDVSAGLEQVLPCIDWAHLYARSRGDLNSRKDFAGVLEKVEAALGRDALKNMHMHCEGIEFGERGEKAHRNLRDSGLEYGELMETLRDFKVKGVLISESPNIEEDALLMQKAYGS